MHFESNRLAPFRTHTVPSLDSKYLSPNPNKALDGVYEQPQGSRDLADTLLAPDCIIENIAMQFESTGTKMHQLVQLSRERSVLEKKIELLKLKKQSERGPGTHSLKAKNNIGLRRVSRVFGLKREGSKSNHRQIYSTIL